MERKIIDYKCIEAETLEDYQKCTNSYHSMMAALNDKEKIEPKYETMEGLNTLVSRLLFDGYEFLGELRVVFEPVNFRPGALPDLSTMTGGKKTYIRELVKYDDTVRL